MKRPISFPLSQDLNIGAALWFASGGSSSARVLLVGTGADELCGGYARYRTKFKARGYATPPCVGHWVQGGFVMKGVHCL